MARPRVSKRSAQGPTTRKENLSSLSTEVLRLRLQALNLPIAGSRTQLIGALKRAATLASSRPPKQTRTSKRSRGHLVPATTSRAKAKDRAAPDDSLVDGEESDSAISDQDDKDPTPVEQPIHTVDDLLRAPEPAQTSSSPFTSDQLRVIQNTVQSSLSQALLDGQIRSRTSASQVQPRPQLRPSGTASPMGLHRPLEKNLEDKISRGEYIDFTGKVKNMDPRSMDPLRGPGPWTGSIKIWTGPLKIR